MAPLPMEQHPDKRVDVLIFRNVKNVAELPTLLKEGKINSVILNEARVVGKLQLAVAINNALHNQKRNTMKTRSINTEIMLCLSPSNNISSSLKIFGMSEQARGAVTVTVSDNDKDAIEEIQKLKSQIHGDLVNDCRGFFYDDFEVSDAYHITKEELSIDTLENSVVMKLATKSC